MLNLLCIVLSFLSVSISEAHIPHGEPRRPVDGKFRKLMVVITGRNNKDWYERNLGGLLGQDYPRSAYHVVYVDDCSDDGTPELVEAYIQQHNLEHMVTLVKNKTRRYKMANFYDAIHNYCDDRAIVVEWDADDWPDNPSVFSLINDVYADKNIWMTYGNLWEWPTNKAEDWIKEVPKSVIKKNAFRYVKYNIWTAMRTFYAWLFKKIKKEDLMWNGQFLRMTSDAAMMFPMFEMAGERFKFIKERVYVHNVATPFNDHKVDGNLQYQTELYVRGLKRYKRLDDSAAAHIRKR